MTDRLPPSADAESIRRALRLARDRIAALKTVLEGQEGVLDELHAKVVQFETKLREIGPSDKPAEVEALVAHVLHSAKHAHLDENRREFLRRTLVRGVLEYLDSGLPTVGGVRTYLELWLRTLKDLSDELDAEIDETSTTTPTDRAAFIEDLVFAVTCPALLVVDLSSIANQFVFSSYVNGTEVASIGVALSSFSNRFGGQRPRNP